MAASQALNDFGALLSMSEALLALEHEMPVTLTDAQLVSSNALKGGAAVLMVGAFETYLQSVFREKLYEIDQSRTTIDITLVKEHIWTEAVFGLLEFSMKGSRTRPESKPKSERLDNVINACQSIISGRVNPDIFSDTESNPNAACVNKMCARVGIFNMFGRVTHKRHTTLHTTTATTYLSDKLDEIIARRNNVAHNVNVSGVARHDLSDAVSFLQELTNDIDKELDEHFSEIMRICARTSSTPTIR